MGRKGKTGGKKVPATRKRSAPSANRGRAGPSADAATPAPRQRGGPPVDATVTATRQRGAPPVDATIDQLQALKLHLQATREKLMLIQPDTLTDEQHAQWSEQIYQVSLAINAVRKALLGTLSGAFAAELPTLEKATNKLTNDLYRLQSAVDVINAISSALGVIASIAALVA